jgi:hypothetical protein
MTLGHQGIAGNTREYILCLWKHVGGFGKPLQRNVSFSSSWLRKAKTLLFSLTNERGGALGRSICAMFGLLLQARRAQLRHQLMSQLQDDGGEAAAAVAPTLDEQLQAAYVPLTGSSACERLP